jgi:hypothetical protein
MKTKRCPDDYMPSDEMAEKLSIETGLSLVDISGYLLEMKDHEFHHPKSDWDATFRNWVRRSAKWDKKKSQPTDPYYEELRRGLADVSD